MQSRRQAQRSGILKLNGGAARLLPEGPEESRAGADGAFGPNAPAMAGDDALNRGETDAGPRELLARMQALERHEQFMSERHVEARAIVAHEISNQLFVFARRAE